MGKNTPKKLFSARADIRDFSPKQEKTVEFFFVAGILSAEDTASHSEFGIVFSVFSKMSLWQFFSITLQLFYLKQAIRSSNRVQQIDFVDWGGPEKGRFFEESTLVTALVPSETACLANSPPPL